MNINQTIPRIQITRADYECRFGMRPDEMALGALIYDQDENPKIEFVFMTTKQEVATLERLYQL
jgi:hypothetical protein